MTICFHPTQTCIKITKCSFLFVYFHSCIFTYQQVIEASLAEKKQGSSQRFS